MDKKENRKITYRLSNHRKHTQPFEILRYQMRLTISLKSLCRGVLILVKRPRVLMNMSETMWYRKRGRRNGRKKEHVLRYSFSGQAFDPYPHLFPR